MRDVVSRGCSVLRLRYVVVAVCMGRNFELHRRSSVRQLLYVGGTMSGEKHCIGFAICLCPHRLSLSLNRSLYLNLSLTKSVIESPSVDLLFQSSFFYPYYNIISISTR